MCWYTCIDPFYTCETRIAVDRVVHVNDFSNLNCLRYSVRVFQNRFHFSIFQMWIGNKWMPQVAMCQWILREANQWIPLQLYCEYPFHQKRSKDKCNTCIRFDRVSQNATIVVFDITLKKLPTMLSSLYLSESVFLRLVTDNTGFHVCYWKLVTKVTVLLPNFVYEF
jgi:hypothetical protein